MHMFACCQPDPVPTEDELPYKENYFLRNQVTLLQAKIKNLEFGTNEKVELTTKVRELETKLQHTENARAKREHQVECLAEAITKAAFKAGITADENAAFSGPQLMLLADDLASAILDMESNISNRLLVPLSADGKYVFIDGPGDVELDYDRKLEDYPKLVKENEQLHTTNEKLVNDLATKEFGHDEDMYRALEAIIDRSKNGELGTSKVIDMRKIAEKALHNLK